MACPLIHSHTEKYSKKYFLSGLQCYLKLKYHHLRLSVCIWQLVCPRHRCQVSPCFLDLQDWRPNPSNLFSRSTDPCTNGVIAHILWALTSALLSLSPSRHAHPSVFTDGSVTELQIKAIYLMVSVGTESFLIGCWTSQGLTLSLSHDTALKKSKTFPQSKELPIDWVWCPLQMRPLTLHSQAHKSDREIH